MTPAPDGKRSGRGWHLCYALALCLLQSPLAAQLAPAPSSTTPSSTGPGERLSGLAPPLPVFSAPHLDASPVVLRPSDHGSRGRLTLAVDVTPKRGMRVYAPGNTGYAAVTFTIDAPVGATLGDVSHPKPERYVFVPLSEQVFVYSTAFRLTREMKVGAGDVRGVLRGSLEYQACDDKVCYRPQTLSLTWRLDR
jgi:DsbC/DsbD-like thiol-disulfide interchange protein